MLAIDNLYTSLQENEIYITFTSNILSITE